MPESANMAGRLSIMRVPGIEVSITHLSYPLSNATVGQFAHLHRNFFASPCKLEVASFFRGYQVCRIAPYQIGSAHSILIISE